ncbi:MAG: TIM44-like domain-containing protein [Ruminiclostridium sp.]|nr:TIM44-like domain-containing protein [Ruminiclostridium sp.]
MKKIVPILLTFILLASLLCGTAFAFDGNDYDYDFDFGGDGGSSSSDGLGILNLILHLFNMGPVGIGIAIILIIIIIISFTKKKSNTSSGAHRNAGQVIPSNQGRFVVIPNRTELIENMMKKHDKNFSASDFVTFAKNVYMDIQTAWCKRDLSTVRPVMHENLYNTTARQVQSKIDQGVVYHYESIAINTAYLTSYARDEQFEYLTCYLNARMIDYQVDEKTGNIIRGDKTTRWDMRYKMKFVRSVGVLTKDETAKHDGHNCPNCGAPMEISSSGVCEYCGSIVTTGQYSWVLTEFTTVRNDTVDEGIKGVVQ